MENRVLAQGISPGNTPYTVEFWLKADEIHNGTFLSPDGASVSRWENCSGSPGSSGYGIHFEQSDNNRKPSYNYDGMNYHPAVNFPVASSAGTRKRLESNANFIIQAPANLIYRSFYVTKSNVTGTTYGSVFAYHLQYDEGWYDNANYLYIAGTAVTSFNPTLSKRYGITSFDRSANTAWHNVRSVSGGTARPLAANTTARPAIGTRGVASTDYPFYGDIQEIIILSTPPGASFNLTEIQKINSYLAIKYGQTLDASQSDLYNTAGNTVWDAVTNNGYHNVFGIARDDATGLYQKQSTNVDEDALTVFLGNTLYALNAQNNQWLNNGVYLLLGSNGLSGVSGYVQAATTPFENMPSGPGEDFTIRQQRIYKAQLTNEASIEVSLQIKKFKAKYVMVSGSASFTPTTATRLYPVTNGRATGVQIGNGDFIGFVLDDATTPGGVSAYKTELWLKSDRLIEGVIPGDNTQVTRWANQTAGDMLDFVRNGSDATPVYRYNGMNYHPALRFEAPAKKLVSENNFETKAGTVYRSFYVSRANITQTNNTYGAVFSYRDTYDEGWCYHTGGNAANYLYINDNTTTTVASYTLFNPGLALRSGITGIDRNSTAAWHNASQTSGGTARPITANNANKASIGTRGPANTTNPFYGDIQEIIILSATGSFNPDTIKKINSYLAIKYGQTLDVIAQPDLFNTAGAMVWNAGINSGYNNVFGVARDDATGLYQKQSTNGNDSTLTVFLGSQLYTLNSDNTGILPNNMTYLLLGSNGLTGTMAYQHPDGTAFDNHTLTDEFFSLRQNRRYRAQLTGGVSSLAVSLQFRNLKADYIMVSGNLNFPPGSTRLYPVTEDNIAEGVEIADGDYIGFALAQSHPGGVTDYIVELWLKAGEIQNGSTQPNGTRVNLWENRSETMINFIQNDNNRKPAYSYGGMNYHPAVSFPTASGVNIARMESDVSFATDAARTYRSFYVSRANLTGTTAYGAVFAYRNNFDEGWRGATNNDYLYYSNNTTAGSHINFSPGAGIRYGITSMDRGVSTGSNAGTVWHNAKPVQGTGQPIATGNAIASIGTKGPTVTTNPFFGDIQEIIILSTSGTPFSSANIQKINSYLAIKYGQTLDFTAQPKLYNSAGNTVWDDVTNNSYNNNVFGIARDDSTGLYQKQSTNVGDTTLTVFLGNTLHTLNAQNTQLLNKGVYLLLGSNGLSGIVNYSYSASEPFANMLSGTGERLVSRQERIYKAQLTNESSLTVSLQIKKFKAKYVMVSASAGFTPGVTRLYPVIDGKATGVQIGNGDFIGFVMDGVTPGGVSNYRVELWLKSDRPIESALPGANAQVTRWANQSGAMLDFVRYNSEAVPVYSYDGMNYHPALRFESSPKKLVSEYGLQTDASRIYRSFYVSAFTVERPTSGTAITYGSVFAYRNNFDEGWRTRRTDDLYLYYSNNTGDANHSGLDPGLLSKQFGITSMDRSGTVWHNASSASGGTARPITTDNGIAVIGTKGPGNTTNPFYGDIQEVIVLSTTSGMPFVQTDIDRINTYLAVKYGQTLDTLALAQWIQSDGTPIWNVASHTGYNKNIFGIGRDDSTGLYQKQSTSVNSNEKITVFTGSGVKPDKLNSQNSGVLSNGFFLMFGSNGILSNNSSRIPYYHPANQSFDNDATTMELEYRHPTVLHSQITGAASDTVNFYLGGLYADYVLVSANPAFPSSGTRIYAVDGNFVASDVAINNNDYVGFAYHLKTPGGISDSLKMWLKADEPSTLDFRVNGDVQEWRDFSGNPNNIYYYNNTSLSAQLAPGFKIIDSDMNFHPAVDYRYISSGSNREYLVTDRAPFDVPATGNSSYPENWTMASVVRLRKPEAANQFFYSTSCYFIGFGAHTLNEDTRHPALGFQIGPVSGRYRNFARIYQEGEAEYNGQNTDLYNTVSSSIVMYSRRQNLAPANFVSYVQFEANANVERNYRGGANAPNGDISYNRQWMGQGGTLGAASLTARAMVGSMAEVIAYQKILPDVDKDKVYSYLALKYGMTLNKRWLQNATPVQAPLPVILPNFDYALSDGTLIWPGSTNLTLHGRFHNNVAAIVRDDAANLNNLQSHSTEEGSSILMGIGSRLGDNGVLTGLNTDKEFIIWGHNGAPFNSVPYPPGGVDGECGDFEEFLQGRIWMVDAGTQENYSVLIGAGNQGFDEVNNVFPYNSPDWQVSMLIADDSAKIKACQWDNVIPGVWIPNVLSTPTISTSTKGLHTFNVVFEAGKTWYFTFGATPTVGNCETCDVDNLLNPIRFTPQTWRNGWTDADFALNSLGLNAHVGARFEGAGNARFYPRSYPRASGGTLLFRRDRDAQQIMKTTIELDSAAIASFDLRRIGYAGGRYTQVKVYGICGSGDILPYLSYATSKDNSFYTIYADGTAKTTKRRVAGAGNRNGWMYVDFDDPVKEIVVEHNSTGRTSGYMYFALGGPINFACPAPPPPVNEEGLSFSQQAMPQEVLLCKEVAYTWRILNTNCDPKEVDFYVKLPAGMKWLHNSLSVDAENITNATIHSYAGTDTLKIDGLTLLGGETTLFRARAYFDISATEGDYTNRARIIYERIENNVPVPDTLFSCDRMTAGCAPTTVKALPAGERLKPLETDGFTLDKTCYAAGDTVMATITVTNPNTVPVNQASLYVDYNEEFSYNTGSLTTALLVGTPDVYIGGGGFMLDGLSNTGFTIPVGTYAISFKLIAPATLEQDVDADNNPIVDEHGYPVYPPLGISFGFETMSEDECADEAFREAYGDIEAEAKPDVFFLGPKHICPGDSTWLSHWKYGTWSSVHPAIAAVNQTDTCTTVYALSPGRTVFHLTLPSGCVVVSDTFTVDACISWLEKNATLNGVQDNGTYENPVAVLFNENIEYQIKVINASLTAGKVTLRDTLPPYLEHTGTLTTYYDRLSALPVPAYLYSYTVTSTIPPPSPPRDIIIWEHTMNPLDSVFVNFEATPVTGVSASSQPMFINKAWIQLPDTALSTNSTYHQGAGISVVTFSQSFGGQIYNATPQILDYKTSARSGVLVVPDEGYRFAGWSHTPYTSLRGELIPANSGVMHYDTLIVYGDIHLRANFTLETYPVTYILHGSVNKADNPSEYTIESPSITLEAPSKANDVFIGWTGSNGEEPQPTVTIPKGSTGERLYYANFLRSGREDKTLDTTVPNEDKIWVYKDELYIHTSKPGSIIKIYTPDGVLRKLHTAVSAGETKIKLQQGIYIVTLNNGTGKKVAILEN